MSIIDQLQGGLISASAAETESIGEQLALALPPDCALALQGDLGSGKTTLVRGIARGLDIRTEVTSPTYTIYTILQGRRQLLHMDAYRLSNAHELDGLAIDEFLKPPFLVVVEWPNHVTDFFEEYPTYWIVMEPLPDHRHALRMIRQPDN